MPAVSRFLEQRNDVNSDQLPSSVGADAYWLDEGNVPFPAPAIGAVVTLAIARYGTRGCDVISPECVLYLELLHGECDGLDLDVGSLSVCLLNVGAR
jgi:hypothetical protein